LSEQQIHHLYDLKAFSLDPLNRQKRAHSPQLAAGLASESKIGKIPYREDSLQLAAGYSSILGPLVPNQSTNSLGDDSKREISLLSRQVK
jgi:hypothetical protein